MVSCTDLGKVLSDFVMAGRAGAYKSIPIPINNAVDNTMTIAIDLLVLVDDIWILV